MRDILTVEAWYPVFGLGCEPDAVRSWIAILEAGDGKRYLRTPFACLDYHPGMEERVFHGGAGTYYRTKADCLAYLRAEYPHWRSALAIMDALCRAQMASSAMAVARLATRLGVSDLDGSLYRLARGHRSFSARQVRKALTALRDTDPQPNQAAY